MTHSPGRLGGSFRDPSGYVFREGAAIYRAIDDNFAALFARVDDDGTLADLTQAGHLIETTRVEAADLLERFSADHAPFRHFLQHTRVPTVTYPYEWSFSMLADAGLRTLDLQLALLDRGLSLKDASAYNVQFINGAPRFIDITSIEAPARVDLWYALGQFGRMFTFPLLLARYRGLDLRSHFLGRLGGSTLDDVVRAFPGLSRWRPALLLDVTLPWWLGRRADRHPKPAPAGSDRPPRGPETQVVNLRRLRRKLIRLRDQNRTAGTWADYTTTCTYDSTAESSKKEQVRTWLQRLRPARVVDLGCNTGDYSYVAASTGAEVVALDGDHDAVERLYIRLKRQAATITPVVADLSNPSPAIGFRNDEREPLLARLVGDAVLALALVHHLLVSANLSLGQIRDLFADLTTGTVVIEFVPVQDAMFRRLLRFRTDRFDHISLEGLVGTFEERFQLDESFAIPGTERTLLLFRKR